ncbi:MAG: AAA family ATPase [Parabacteroides sp.]|nr:AAA family ATPase [Parabacteroides sp.]
MYKSDYEVFYNETVHEYMSEKNVPVVKSDFDKNFWLSYMQSTEIARLTLQRTGLPLTADQLKEGITVDILDKKREDRVPIFKVEITSTHPAEIPLIMSAYMESLNELLLKHQQSNSQRLIDFLTKQIAENNEKLNVLDKQVLSMAATRTGGMLDVDRLQANLESFRMDLMKAQITLSTLKASRQRTESALKNLDGTIVNESAFTEPVKVQLMNLEVDLARALTKNREDHPSVKAIRSNIKQLNVMLRDSLENRMQIKSLMENPLKTQLMSKLMELQIAEVSEETHVASLERVIGDLEHQTLPDSADENQQQVLRNREMVFMTIKQLNLNLIEAQSASSGSLSRFVMVDEPDVPAVPANKGIAFFIAVGLMAGLAVAAGLVFLYDMLDNRLMVTGDFECFYTWPVLGSFGHRKQDAFDDRGLKEPAAGGYAGWSDLSSVVVNLRQAIKYKDKRVLAVCSSVRQEGKSLVSLELARALAHKKLRVLLVDMDFFAPKLSGMLQRTDSRGLSDLLAGGGNLEGVLQETRVPSLWFTAAGTVKERRDLLYDDPALAAFLREVRQRFDVVIVDTPAALFVPEVVGVMEHMDGIILMVRLEVTSRVALDKLKGLLQSHNLPVLGAIINGVKENVLNKYTGYHAERYRYYPDGEADRASGAVVPEVQRVPLLRKFRLRKWMYFFLAFQALAIAGWLGYVTAGKRFAARQTAVVPEVRVPAPALVADTALVVDSASVANTDAPQWLDTVVVEAGTRLTLLSLSYYGDKVFWVYLYIANRDVIKDPNRVPAGASLRIPMPDRYGIDAADKESVARAAKLQREILAGNFEGVDALDKQTVNR